MRLSIYISQIRNKKSFFFILMFSVLTTLFTITLNFYQSYKNMINNGLKNDILYRNILLAPIDKYGKQIQNVESLKKIEHVVDIHDMKYDSIDLYVNEYKNTNHDGIIEFAYGAENIKVIAGKKKISSGELICSQNFYPSFELKKQRKFFSIEEILNKNLTIEEKIYRRISGKYEETKMKYTKTFKIAALYDPIVTGSTLNTCYATKEDMKEIYDTLYVDLNPDSLTSYIITIDKYENVNQMMSLLEDKNYVVSTQVVNDSTLFNKIKNISLITMIFTIVIYLALTVFYIKKNIIDSNRELIILNYLGIDQEKIVLLESNKTLLLLLLGYIFGSIFYMLLIFLIKILFHDYLLFNSYIINYKLWLLTASAICIIFAYIFAHILIYKYIVRHSR